MKRTEAQQRFKRLELIGDGVVSVAAALMLEHYNIGNLELDKLRATLISNAQLKKFAITRKLNRHKDDSGNRKKALANAYEHKAGLLLLDKGIAAALEFVKQDMHKYLHTRYYKKRVPEIQTQKMNLKELVKDCHEAADKNGFWADRKALPKAVPEELKQFANGLIRSQLLLLVSSEVSEAMEADRKDKFVDKDAATQTWLITNKDQFKAMFEKSVKGTFEDEISDVFIRLFDLCGGLGIDIEQHINMKMRYNATRAKKHGKQF